MTRIYSDGVIDFNNLSKTLDVAPIRSMSILLGGRGGTKGRNVDVIMAINKLSDCFTEICKNKRKKE